jgi:hypothetical protein
MALVTLEVTWLHWLLEDFSVSIFRGLLFCLTIQVLLVISIACDPVKHYLTKI